MASKAGRLAAVSGAADLIEYAYGLRFQDGSEAVKAAQRAVRLLAGVHLRTPIHEGCDLRSRAWGVLGNSLRITGSLRAAGTALNVADGWRRMGSGSPRLEVEALGFRASLAIANRQLPDAEELLLRAEAVAIEMRDGEEQSRARIKRAIVATYEGHPEEATSIILSALGSGGWTLDLRRCALEVLMFAYALADEPRRALEVWLLSAALYEGCGDLMRLKLRWVRGLIGAQLFGRVSELSELQREYVAREMPYDAALVGLDMAVCAAQSGDVATARARLDEAEPILRLCGLPEGADCSPMSLRALRLALSATSMREAAVV